MPANKDVSPGRSGRPRGQPGQTHKPVAHDAKQPSDPARRIPKAAVLGATAVLAALACLVAIVLYSRSSGSSSPSAKEPIGKPVRSVPKGTRHTVTHPTAKPAPRKAKPKVKKAAHKTHKVGPRKHKPATRRQSPTPSQPPPVVTPVAVNPVTSAAPAVVPSAKPVSPAKPTKPAAVKTVKRIPLPKLPPKEVVLPPLPPVPTTTSP